MPGESSTTPGDPDAGWRHLPHGRGQLWPVVLHRPQADLVQQVRKGALHQTPVLDT